MLSDRARSAGGLMLLLLAGGAAADDTDGRYCVGPGYAAVETRGIFLGSVKPAVRIMKVGGDGIGKPLTVDAGGLNLNAMQCEGEYILFNGGKAIDLSEPEPRIITVPPAVEPLPEDETAPLPWIQAPQAIPIPSKNPHHRFTLVLDHVWESRISGDAGLILNHFSARVVQSTADGRFVAARVLAEGIRTDTVD